MIAQATRTFAAYLVKCLQYLVMRAAPPIYMHDTTHEIVITKKRMHGRIIYLLIVYA